MERDKIDQRMSSSSEDEEASEESSYQSEFSDDGERTSDQEETDQEEDDRSPCTEKRGQDEGERKVTLRSKQERKRTKKRKDRISDQEETDSREEGRLSHDIKLETHKKVGELEEGLMTLGDREETRGKRKKVEGGREDELTETVAGIVYLSRVPPFMKPHKVKHLLSCYGSVGRVYLKPEGQCSEVLLDRHLCEYTCIFDFICHIECGVPFPHLFYM